LAVYRPRGPKRGAPAVYRGRGAGQLFGPRGSLRVLWTELALMTAHGRGACSAEGGAVAGGLSSPMDWGRRAAGGPCGFGSGRGSGPARVGTPPRGDSGLSSPADTKAAETGVGPLGVFELERRGFGRGGAVMRPRLDPVNSAKPTLPCCCDDWARFRASPGSGAAFAATRNPGTRRSTPPVCRVRWAGKGRIRFAFSVVPPRWPSPATPTGGFKHSAGQAPIVHLLFSHNSREWKAFFWRGS